MAANPTKSASKRANSRKLKAKPASPVTTRSPSARTSFTSNRAAPTSSLIGCVPSASSKPPDIRPSSAWTLSRFEVALIQRGMAAASHRGLSWVSTREGLRLGWAEWRHARPAHEFRERDGAPSIIKI